MSQQPPHGPAGTPDEAAHGAEPTESFANSPYDVPAPADQTEQLPAGSAPGPDYGQAPDPTRTIYAGTSTTAPDGDLEPEPGRPRWVVPVVIAVILLLVAGGVAAAYFLGERDDTPPPVTPTAETTAEPETTPEATTEPTATAEPTPEETTEPATTPEPTAEPTEEASTELLEDLDETVSVGDLTFTLDGELTADEDILEQDALEAWRGEYVSGEAEIELLATLWVDNEAADAYAAELVESVDGEEIETGYTYTNETGTFWAFILQDGRGSYVWTTDRGHVLQVIGSTDYVGGFYSNFPL